MIRATISIIVILISLTLFSCKENPPNNYDSKDLVVVSDASISDATTNLFFITFDKIRYTPKPEKYFKSIIVKPSELERHLNHSNIILFIDKSNKSALLNKLSPLLSKNELDSIMTENSSLLIKHNLWSENQTVAIISISDSINSTKLNNYGVKVFTLFQQSKVNKLKSDLSLIPISFDSLLMPNKAKDLGFILDFTNKYKPLITEKGKAIIKSDRDSTTTIHFLLKSVQLQSSKIEKSGIHNYHISLLKEIKMPDGAACTIIDTGVIRTTNIKVAGLKGIKLEGPWESENRLWGGAVTTFLFYDVIKDKLYSITGLIYSPKESMIDLVEETEVILSSFRRVK